MTADLRTVYAQYVDYVSRLRVDFDRHVGRNVSEDYRAKILQYDDFRVWWGRLADGEGLQERWRRRFELGYEAYCRAVTDRLERVLARADQPEQSPLLWTLHSRRSRRSGRHR